MLTNYNFALELQNITSQTMFRNYTGPNPTSPEHKGSSQKNFSRAPYSPGYEFEEDSHSKYLSDRSRTKNYQERDMEDSEVGLTRKDCLHMIVYS